MNLTNLWEISLLKVACVILGRHQERLAAGFSAADSKEFQTLGAFVKILIEELGTRGEQNPLEWRIVRAKKDGSNN